MFYPEGKDEWKDIRSTEMKRCMGTFGRNSRKIHCIINEDCFKRKEAIEGKTVGLHIIILDRQCGTVWWFYFVTIHNENHKLITYIAH